MTQQLRLTPEQLAAIQARRKPANKFGAVKKQVDGITFDSTHEAECYQQLKMLQMAGDITDLQCHVPLRIEINGQHVFNYECDFRFREISPVDARVSRARHQDAKGYKKGAAYQLFRLKKAVIKAVLGIEIEEV